MQTNQSPSGVTLINNKSKELVVTLTP